MTISSLVVFFAWPGASSPGEVVEEIRGRKRRQPVRSGRNVVGSRFLVMAGRIPAIHVLGRRSATEEPANQTPKPMQEPALAMHGLIIVLSPLFHSMSPGGDLRVRPQTREFDFAVSDKVVGPTGQLPVAYRGAQCRLSIPLCICPLSRTEWSDHLLATTTGAEMTCNCIFA
jgi:hypothetical protein